MTRTSDKGGVGLSPEEHVDFRVPSEVRARELLLSMLGSKQAVARVFAHQGLLRDGVPLLPTDDLVAGQLLTLQLEAPDTLPPSSDGSVEVIYLDRLLLAADKPAGILVHADGTGADTLTARVQGLLKRQGSAAVAQAVQRLDVETTGLVLFSLTREFQPVLDAQVAGHEMRKCYLAVVEGTRWPASDGCLRLEWPIARDRHDARRMRVGRSGKPSVTEVKALQRVGGKTLLQVELQTGRRHQIRVHLAHAGHPVVGDTLYGGSRCHEGLMLHCWEERIVHPLTGQVLDVRTPWPERFGRMGFDER